MAIETNLSRIPLRSLGLSHELIQVLDDAGLHTLQDFEDRTAALFKSQLYDEKYLAEITGKLLKQMEEIQELAKSLNERKRKRGWWRWRR
jgi:lysyl-tRNA synthetase class I